MTKLVDRDDALCQLFQAGDKRLKKDATPSPRGAAHAPVKRV